MISDIFQDCDEITCFLLSLWLLLSNSFDCFMELIYAMCKGPVEVWHECVVLKLWIERVPFLSCKSTLTFQCFLHSLNGEDDASSFLPSVFECTVHCFHFDLRIYMFHVVYTEQYLPSCSRRNRGSASGRPERHALGVIEGSSSQCLSEFSLWPTGTSLWCFSLCNFNWSHTS